MRLELPPAKFPSRLFLMTAYLVITVMGCVCNEYFPTMARETSDLARSATGRDFSRRIQLSVHS